MSLQFWAQNTSASAGKTAKVDNDAFGLAQVVRTLMAGDCQADAQRVPPQIRDRVKQGK